MSYPEIHDVLDVLLPVANEVWVKVMFSQVFICPLGGGVLCMISLPVWLSSPMFFLRVSVWEVSAKGVSVQDSLCPGESAEKWTVRILLLSCLLAMRSTVTFIGTNKSHG